MKVLISGASGLVGSALRKSLLADGHEVTRLVRRTARRDEVFWDPEKGEIDRVSLDKGRFSAIVHLAGENIAAQRWTFAQKEKIRDSRILGTNLLAEEALKLQRRPDCFISASAIGYYGDRKDEVLTEDSEPGAGFLPQTCIDWEQAAQPVDAGGIRLVKLRIGIVLGKDGGALKKMLLPFKFGLGGRLGSGAQYMSWISLTDLVRAIRFAIDESTLHGAYNLTAPNPVSNELFTKTLGKVLRRPTFLPTPTFALNLMVGEEMARTLLLSGCRVLPQRLLDAGFAFQHEDLEVALRAELGRPTPARGG